MGIKKKSIGEETKTGAVTSRTNVRMAILLFQFPVSRYKKKNQSAYDDRHRRLMICLPTYLPTYPPTYLPTCAFSVVDYR